MIVALPQEDPREIPPTKYLLILSLGGGGFRGLFTIEFLKHLVADIGSQTFEEAVDVYAGTSVGGLLACGLSIGLSASELSSKVQQHGESIFKRDLRVLGCPTGIKKSPSSLYHRLFSSLYKADGLKAAIRDTIGNGRDVALTDIDKSLVVPSVCSTTLRPVIFVSRGLNKSKATQDLLTEVALSTSAAPTYFPAFKKKGRSLIDGGLIANAPDLVALTEVIEARKAKLRQVRILSIGTASPAGADVPSENSPRGIGGWLASGLFKVTLSAQEELIVRQCRSLLRENYIRIDANPSPKQARVLELDRADDKSKETLKLLAQEVWDREKNKGWIRTLFSQRDRS